MSWDADVCGHSWNYTHNTNRMIATAAESAGYDLGDEAWYRWLDGRTIDSGRPFLAAIVREMEAHPETYEAMNPENGWGSYDSLLDTLREMRDVRPPSTTWAVSG